MRSALFLGSGASKPFGYPVTKEIFPEILEKLKDKKLFRSGEAHPERMARLEELLMEFFPGALEAEVELPLVTDALSLVDELSVSGVAPSRKSKPQDADELRQLLERSILSILLSREDSKKNGHLLDKLARWVSKDDHASSVSIVSTNYDLVVERPIYESIGQNQVPTTVDFGVSWRSPFEDRVHNRPDNARIGIYKLHGSMNWLRCPLCQHIYINTRGPIYQKAYRDGIDHENTCHCGYAPLQPIVVTPSFVRSIRDPALLSVWNSSLEALRTADEWILAGYSLPSEDITIRSILVRAYRARKESPRIRVVQKADDESVRKRYRFLFPECEFELGGFEGYLEQLPEIP